MSNKAKVTTAFPGVKDEEVYPTNFKVGDVVEGELAKVAVENKWAEPVSEKEAEKLKAAADKNNETDEEKTEMENKPTQQNSKSGKARK